MVSKLVTNALNFTNVISRAGRFNTCFVSYDICLDNTTRAGVLCNISVVATDFESCISGSIRIQYTEMLSRSQWRSES
jgi:hypothetical protein